jgi:hypothetical protein
VTDVLGATASALDDLQVVPALAVVGFAANRTALDVGQSMSVGATLVGGDGPIVYAYTGLPLGCASVSAGVLTCRPSVAGSFSIALGATDVLGATSTGSTTVQVNPLPSILSVVPSNATAAAGGSVSISTVIAGGTAPFQYRYAGLPEGCTAVATAVVTCSSVAEGNYTVGVTVTDSTGATATGSARFAVLPSPIQVVPTGQPVSPPGFWWGFALAAVVIAVAGVIGARRLYLTRQGTALVRELGAPRDSSSSSTTQKAEASEDEVGPDQ